MTNQILSTEETEEARRTLTELEKYLPNDESNLTYHFGRFLARRLRPYLTPFGFFIQCEYALLDLGNGFDTYTEQQPQKELIGHHWRTYSRFRREIPRIAEVVFPRTFAAEVKKCMTMDKIDGKLRNKES